MSRILILSLTFLFASTGSAETAPPTGSEEQESSVLAAENSTIDARIEALEKPLYSPFIERYVLDELKQLRTDLLNQKAELIQQMTDRQIGSIDRGVTYATDTITYFFYLIAAVSSMLVILGWNSIRDIKDKVHTLADEEINKLVRQYEERLDSIEQQLNQKTRHIKKNKEEIELTQEVQSLWLRAGQDHSIYNKVAIYDQILKLKPDDCEAFTYKADAVLELKEPQWAANLCQQALAIDPNNAHAFYQLACAHTAMDRLDEALQYLKQALEQSETYREYMLTDDALIPLRGLPEFSEISVKS